MASGGYRPPTNPAPVSGPGKLSRRTDGGPAQPPQQPIRDIPNAAYGEQQTFRADQAGAPMATTPGPDNQPQTPPVDLSNVVPLHADTQRPNEPVTAGADAGAGPGAAALGLPNPGDDASVQNLRQLLPPLELMANSPVAGTAFKDFVRRVRAMM